MDVHVWPPLWEQNGHQWMGLELLHCNPDESLKSGKSLVSQLMIYGVIVFWPCSWWYMVYGWHRFRVGSLPCRNVQDSQPDSWWFALKTTVSSVQNPSIIPWNTGWLKSGCPVLGFFPQDIKGSFSSPELIMNQSSFISYIHSYPHISMVKAIWN